MSVPLLQRSLIPFMKAPPSLLKNLPNVPPGASLVAQWWRIRLPMQETWVRSLGREDPLEKEIATHSSILAWRIPWTEKPSGLQSMGSQRVGHDWVTSLELNYLDFRGLLSNGSDLVAKSCLTLATPWTVTVQASLSMGFSRQEYWSGLPFPSPKLKIEST